MRLEIIRPNGDLEREVWQFNLNLGLTGSPCIYLQYYSFQTRGTKRHKWVEQTHWQKIDRRYNNISDPPLPPDVEDEMRKRYQEYILTLHVIKETYEPVEPEDAQIAEDMKSYWANLNAGSAR